MGFIYEPGQGMTEPQIKQGNRLVLLTTPATGSTFIDYSSANDDLSLVNIGETHANSTEIPGQGGGTNYTLRVSVRTRDDISQSYIQIYGNMHYRNVTGAVRDFLLEVQYGTGASPSSWTTAQYYRKGISISDGLADQHYHQETVSAMIGKKDANSGITLAPNTIYTFRYTIWSAAVATADVDILCATLDTPRTIWATMHFF